MAHDGRARRAENIFLVFLPSRSPEPSPVENIWQYLRASWLSNSVFDSYDVIDVRVRRSLQLPTSMVVSQFGADLDVDETAPPSPDNDIAGGMIGGSGEITAEADQFRHVKSERTQLGALISGVAEELVEDGDFRSCECEVGSASGSARAIMVIHITRQLTMQ